MRTVLIKVPATDLSNELAAMREWLDQHGCEPYKFTYNRWHNTVAVYFEFSRDADGEAFRSHFINWNPADHLDVLLGKEQEWLLRFSGGDPEDRYPRETMAQACWWRLKAEEARAEGEAFASASAKRTMEIVASAWESMAEDLERRLAQRSS